MFNDVLYLISETVQVDDSTGDWVTEKSSKPCFCEVKSISMSEFYQANAEGFKPELKFVIADYLDYNDERIVNYDGRDYEVIRTYRSQGNSLEITVQRQVNKS